MTNTAFAGHPLLTPTGVAVLRLLLGDAFRPAEAPAQVTECARHPFQPYWDAQRRQLWLGDRLLAEYRRPTPHVAAVLDAFQAGGWEKGYVDDPALREPGTEAHTIRAELSRAVEDLNRTLPPSTLTFHRGSGWVWVEVHLPDDHGWAEGEVEDGVLASPAGYCS